MRLVWLGMDRRGKLGSVQARQGEAGKAGSGVYWQGKVRRGPVRFGRLGKVWLVVSRYDKDWFGRRG